MFSPSGVVVPSSEARWLPAVRSETVSDTDPPRDGQALDDDEGDLVDGGDDEAEQGPGEDLREGVGRPDACDPGEQQLPESGALHEGGDHRDGDRDQRGDADAVEDDRPG